MPTLTVYPDPNPEAVSVDGLVQAGGGLQVTWANLIGHVGSLAFPSLVTDSIIGFSSDSISNLWASNKRSIYGFDVSALPNDTFLYPITNAILSIYGAVWPSDLTGFSDNCHTECDYLH